MMEEKLELGKSCPICGRIVYSLHTNLCVTHGDKELAIYDTRKWILGGWPHGDYEEKLVYPELTKSEKFWDALHKLLWSALGR